MPRPRPGSSARSKSPAAEPRRALRSGLEPAPHLVGERARALDVLAARAGRRLCRGRRRRTAARRRAAGADPASITPTTSPSASPWPATSGSSGPRSAASSQSAAGSSTSSRPPVASRRDRALRDEIESIRAFSPFTQRTPHSLDEAVIYPATERRATSTSPRSSTRTVLVPDDLVPPLGRAPTSSGSRTRCARLVGGGARAAATRRRGGARPVPERSAVRVRGAAAGDRRTRPGRGRERARGARSRRPGSSSPSPTRARRRNQNLLRRVESRLFEAGDELPGDAELLYAVSPARRGFVWRDLGIALLPDTQVFRRNRAPRRSAARSSRSPTCAPATTPSTGRPRVSKLLGVRDQRRSPGNATTCCSRSEETIASTSRTSSSARSRATSG